MRETISRDELVDAIGDQDVTIIETLRDEHFAAGHLPGAIHIHYEQIVDRAAELLPDRDALIVAYCSNAECRNSEIAATELRRLGYTNVRRYVDGKQDWTAAGLALEVEGLAAQ